MLGDEAAQAFRSIGYLDYLGSSFQTQPVDWFKDQELPRWTLLSFHDDPPLFFLIQHLFFNVFGDTPLTARLPAVFAGTFSTWLIYLIFRKVLSLKKLNTLSSGEKGPDHSRGADSGRLQMSNVSGYYSPLNYSEAVSLLAAGIFAIEPATVGIFRTSLLEPVLIFFILLNLYYFLLFLENRKQWLIFGLTFGLVALTKYTGVFLLPVYGFFLFSEYINSENKKSVLSLLKDYRLYLSLLITLLLFTPVLIYNFYLYQAVGHFDLQLAYLFGQETPEWTGLVGKEQSPFADIIINLNKSYGWELLILTLFGALNSIRRYRGGERGIALIWLYLAFLGLLLVKIGSASRFLVMLSPGIVILTAIGLWEIWNLSSSKYVGYFLKLFIILFLIFEFNVSVNRNIINFPSYGIAGLDNYFMEEFKGVESAVIPESDNRHLNNLIHSFAKEKSDKPRAKVLIVYNDNIALPTLEWIFYRRFFYHSMPTLFIENFQKVLSSAGPDYFRGFTVYFVQSTENTILNPFKAEKSVGAEFEKLIIGNGVSVDRSIAGTDGKEMFRIYKWSM